MTVRMVQGKLIVSSPFCSGNPRDKSFRAHAWLPVDTSYRVFRCPVCLTRGEI